MGSTGARARVMARLVLVAGAVGLGALAYRDLFSPVLPWWRWLADLTAGCALLIVGLAEREAAAESRWRRWARAGAMLIAIVAGAAAVDLGVQPGREWGASVAVVLAVAAFFAARWVPFAPDDIATLIGPVATRRRSSIGQRMLRGVGALASVVSVATAIRINQGHHLAAFLLWLAGLALFAVAAWRRDADESESSPSRWVMQAGPPLSGRVVALTLLVTLLLAAALRMAVLDRVPAGINPDEGRQGRCAERLWANGFPDAFGLGWNVFPNLSYMAQYVFVQARGTSIANLRLSSAAVGVLSLVPLFFWARRWWGDFVALLAVFLLAINVEHIVWSRIGLDNVQQILVATLMLAAFARVLRTHRAVDWVWLGYAAGLAFYTYHAAKLFPVLLVAVAILFAVGIRGFVRTFLPGALVGALAFLLGFAPLLATIWADWAGFYAGTSNRVDLVQLTTAYHRGDVPAVRGYLYTHVVGCLMSFLSYPLPAEGVFDPFVAVPFLLGLGWMLWRWRDPRHLLVLAWLFGIVGIGGMITDYPPAHTRMMGCLPAAVLIPAVTIGRMRGWLWRAWPGRADAVVVPIVVVWLAAALTHNGHFLFVEMAAAGRGDTMTEICHAVEHVPLPATVYMAGAAPMAEPKDALHGCMVAANPERVIVDLSDDPAIVPIPPTHRGHAVLLVAHRSQSGLLPLVRHFYPEAREDPVYDIAGRPFLHVFNVPADMVERRRGLFGTFQSPDRTWAAAAGSDVFAPPEGAAWPLAATWRGLVWIPQPGPYAFRATAGSLRLDGVALAETDRPVLPAGWHAIELAARFEQPAERILLAWLPPDAEQWMPIPRASLHAHPEAHGLLGRYYAGRIEAAGAAPIAAPPQYARIEAVLSFDWFTHWDESPPAPFAAIPSTMEWVGTLDLPESGSAGVRVEATVPVQVFVDGRLLLAVAKVGDAARGEAEITGRPGRVPILVRTNRPPDDDWRTWKLHVLWREPGGGWTAFAPYHFEDTPLPGTAP